MAARGSWVFMAWISVFVALALLAVAPVVAAGGGPSAGFGQPGVPVFLEIPLPEGLPNVAGAGEPTIGIPWDTDHVFFQAFASTYRCDFSALANVSLPGESEIEADCSDVTPAFSLTNLDPMLHVDPVSGRVFAGGLNGPCSLMGISDDDGQTWLPSRNMCTGHQLDHQSIGSGPWSATAPDTVARNLVYARSTYYCAQGALVGAVVIGVTDPAAACATSVDGGFTWQPFAEVLGGCGGYHGHIRVSEATGFAVLPFANCAGKVGYAFSADNGLTWSSATFSDSRMGDSVGFDPSVGFSIKSGWMYYALANDIGLHVALSKDDGKTWDTIGNRTVGVTPSTWLNVAPAYLDPKTGQPLRFTTFTNVQAGDDDRVAIAFMGTTDEGEKPFSCGPESDGLAWHYYLAQSLDAGQAWTITRLSEDPVQIGGIDDGGLGAGACRNLLDFNDMDIDSKGRVNIGFADGCIGDCAADYAAYAAGSGDKPKPSTSGGAYGTILRQVSGPGLFAAEDRPADQDGTSVTVVPSADEQPVPGVSPIVLTVGLVVLAFALRRRLAS